jgi:hypothetical protein
MSEAKKRLAQKSIPEYSIHQSSRKTHFLSTNNFAITTRFITTAFTTDGLFPDTGM